MHTYISEENRLWTEELIGCMVTELLSNMNDCVDSGITFLSLTKDCLTWDYKGRLFTVSYWLKYAHKLMEKIEKMPSNNNNNTTAAAAKMLRELAVSTVPCTTNHKVLVQAIYLLAKHLSKADLASGGLFTNIANRVKAVFLRADELEALKKGADPAAAPVTLEGYTPPVERCALDRDLAVKGIRCLVTLASRESAFAPPLANYIAEYAQYFAHDKAFQVKIEQLARTAASFVKGARNLGQQDPRLYINGYELAARPLFSLDDDALWLSVKKAFRATHAQNGFAKKWSSPRVLSAQSDMALVKMSHMLLPDSKKIVSNN